LRIERVFHGTILTAMALCDVAKGVDNAGLFGFGHAGKKR
jgi:hypothetical protein